MKRGMILLAMAAMTLAAVPRPTAGATSSTAVSSGAGIRIAYVDLERVTENSKSVRERVGTVQKDLEEKQKQYKTKAEDLRQLTQQLNQQGSVLTEAQSTQLKERVRSLRDELDRLQYDADRIMNKTSQDIIEPVLDEVLQSVERVATLYKVDLVLRGDLVLYASERVDLTDAVIQELDRRAAAGIKAPITPASTPARRSIMPGADLKKAGSGPRAVPTEAPRKSTEK